jgi:hypothetical protein
MTESLLSLGNDVTDILIAQFKERELVSLMRVNKYLYEKIKQVVDKHHENLKKNPLFLFHIINDELTLTAKKLPPLTLDKLYDVLFYINVRNMSIMAELIIIFMHSISGSHVLTISRTLGRVKNMFTSLFVCAAAAKYIADNSCSNVESDLLMAKINRIINLILKPCNNIPHIYLPWDLLICLNTGFAELSNTYNIPEPFIKHYELFKRANNEMFGYSGHTFGIDLDFIVEMASKNSLTSTYYLLLIKSFAPLRDKILRRLDNNVSVAPGEYPENNYQYRVDTYLVHTKCEPTKVEKAMRKALPLDYSEPIHIAIPLTIHDMDPRNCESADNKLIDREPFPFTTGSYLREYYEKYKKEITGWVQLAVRFFDKRKTVAMLRDIFKGLTTEQILAKLQTPGNKLIILCFFDYYQYISPINMYIVALELSRHSTGGDFDYDPLNIYQMMKLTEIKRLNNIPVINYIIENHLESMTSLVNRCLNHYIRGFFELPNAILTYHLLLQHSKDPRFGDYEQYYNSLMTLPIRDYLGELEK